MILLVVPICCQLGQIEGAILLDWDDGAAAALEDTGEGEGWKEETVEK